MIRKSLLSKKRLDRVEEGCEERSLRLKAFENATWKSTTSEVVLNIYMYIYIALQQGAILPLDATDYQTKSPVPSMGDLFSGC